MAGPRIKGAKGKSVKMTGIPELRAKLLKELPAAAHTRIRKAITETTEAVFNKSIARAQQPWSDNPRARVSTQMWRKIRRSVNKKGTRGRVTHARSAFPLRFRETGTRSHGRGGGPLKAKPWLFPSVEEERAPHIGRLRDAMRQAAQDVAE